MIYILKNFVLIYFFIALLDFVFITTLKLISSGTKENYKRIISFCLFLSLFWICSLIDIAKNIIKIEKIQGGKEWEKLFYL